LGICFEEIKHYPIWTVSETSLKRTQGFVLRRDHIIKITQTIFETSLKRTQGFVLRRQNIMDPPGQFLRLP
jgi:hypothetical protein